MNTHKMAKIVKMNHVIKPPKKSYYSRFQTKLRRRREGKTDYKHRRAMIKQDVNKQGYVKSRLVVRITNSRIICQIVKAYVNGDRITCSADSTELKKYGITFGLTNYSAAYATGLLLARRLLEQSNLAEIYKPKETDGEINVVENEEGEQRAYLCYLDIGLKKSSKGARVFAAMKGASDGGLKIPHSPKNLPGYSKEKFDSEELRNKIYGKSIADYMNSLQENDSSKFKTLFSDYLKKGIKADDLENIYDNAFNKIKEDCSKEDKPKKDYSANKKFKTKKLTKEESIAKIDAKKKALIKN